jgi:regulator of sigma E protease
MAYVFAILGLSVLIVLHEMGHMITARLSGMRVLTFSIGFGPALLRWRGPKTTYQLALIPLGGYVQIAGMNPNEKLPPDDPGSYANKSSAARFATIFAGPLVNFLVAMVMMAVMAMTWGVPFTRHNVKAVSKGTPAAKGGMQSGDMIERIEGHAIDPSPDGIPQIRGAIESSKGRALRFLVRRGEGHAKLSIAPAAKGSTYRIGIQFGSKISFGEVSNKDALYYGLVQPWHISKRALEGLGNKLGDIFTGKTGGPQMGGPVEIVHQLKLSIEMGPSMTTYFLAMLSVLLGMFNLLPIPALDGGRLLFLITTMVSRRPINQRVENMVHTVGFVLLLGLIALVTYGDIARRMAD